MSYQNREHLTETHFLDRRLGGISSTYVQGGNRVGNGGVNGVRDLKRNEVLRSGGSMEEQAVEHEEHDHVQQQTDLSGAGAREEEHGASRPKKSWNSR